MTCHDFVCIMCCKNAINNKNIFKPISYFIGFGGSQVNVWDGIRVPSSSFLATLLLCNHYYTSFAYS